MKCLWNIVGSETGPAGKLTVTQRSALRKSEDFVRGNWMKLPEDVYPRKKMGRSNLVGHAYSWGINTHVAMLLLENTRSWQGRAPPGENCCNQHHDCDSTEFIRKFISFNCIDSTSSVSECRQLLWSDIMDTRRFCNVQSNENWPKIRVTERVSLAGASARRKASRYNDGSPCASQRDDQWPINLIRTAQSV
jgi:hypothetical protein